MHSRRALPGRKGLLTFSTRCGFWRERWRHSGTGRGTPADTSFSADRRRIGGSLYSDAMGTAGTSEGTYPGMVRHNIDTIVDALLGKSEPMTVRD